MISMVQSAETEGNTCVHHNHTTLADSNANVYDSHFPSRSESLSADRKLKPKPWQNPVCSLIENNPFSPEVHGFQRIEGAPLPLPLEKPPFTLKQIRDVIPPHCFKRCVLKSILYTVYNIGVCATLFYAATWIDHDQFPLPSWIAWTLWPIYWFLQGVYMFGLWILAHECGHEAYSDYPLLNDIVGLILHSFVLVPFHSWKYSHRKHHLNTGSAENDEIFVPRTRTEITEYIEKTREELKNSKWKSKLNEILEESPIYNLIRLIVILLTGLHPLYLVFNFSGPVKYQGKNANHFSPSAVIFLPKQKKSIIVTDIVFFSWVTALLFLNYEYSFASVFFYYGVPQLVVNCILVLITLLQHTDTYVPHFRGADWNWLRGALCTVDRSFGPWLDGVFHHISDTHVCHHLFPKLPFYHAQEATEAISKVLGKYRMVDETPIWKALWRAYNNCIFVEDEGPVCFYKSSLKSSKTL